jgi:hypothetical protein
MTSWMDSFGSSAAAGLFRVFVDNSNGQLADTQHESDSRLFKRFETPIVERLVERDDLQLGMKLLSSLHDRAYEE